MKELLYILAYKPSCI